MNTDESIVFVFIPQDFQFIKKEEFTFVGMFPSHNFYLKVEVSSLNFIDLTRSCLIT
jgi:hypothetical protein